MPRVAVLLDEGEHSNLKAYAARSRKSMNDVIKAAIASYTVRTVHGPLTNDRKAQVREKKRVAGLCEECAPELFAEGETFGVTEFRKRLVQRSTTQTVPTRKEVAKFDEESAYKLLHARSGSGKTFDSLGEQRYQVRPSIYRAREIRRREG
ncbi:hypothetical protein [Methylobacterium bullatum]|jgi:hypothetical protein|uniref:Uncharacterized protein n=1 Tax=Methylobacterium bullatum TaxID=570505 RepID=A0A679JPZ3_9HYPH|nr:hypothetical protein MBLL_00357 [Methylobacterium bullatum]